MQAKVIAVDEEKRRISLSLRQSVGQALSAAPMESQAERASPRKERKRPLKGGLD